jgi:uncharacterized protein YkwD
MTASLSAGCTGAPVRGEPTPIAVSAGAAAAMVSAYRARNGFGPVGTDPRLNSVASAQAMAMAGRDRLSHSAGGSLPRRLSAGGYAWDATAENIGAGYASLGAAMQGWEESPEHRKNLLNSHVTEIGVAAAAAPPGSRFRTYWSLVLATPRT